MYLSILFSLLCIFVNTSILNDSACYLLFHLHYGFKTAET